MRFFRFVIRSFKWSTQAIWVPCRVPNIRRDQKYADYIRDAEEGLSGLNFGDPESAEVPLAIAVVDENLAEFRRRFEGFEKKASHIYTIAAAVASAILIGATTHRIETGWAVVAFLPAAWAMVCTTRVPAPMATRSPLAAHEVTEALIKGLLQESTIAKVHTYESLRIANRWKSKLVEYASWCILISLGMMVLVLLFGLAPPPPPSK